MQILVVEDSAADAELVQLHLQGALPTAVFSRAEDLEGALARLVDPVDLVLLDLGLPDSSDLEGLEAILALPDPPPVIVLTGNIDERRALAAVQHGAQDYVLKGSMSSEALGKAVLYAIERHRLKRRLEEETRSSRAWEESFRGIANNADGLVVVDGAGSILWANPVATALLGVERAADLVGERLPWDGTGEQELEGRVLQVRSGPTTWAGEPADVISVRDVTRRVRSEERVRQAQQLSLLGRVAAGVAHDFGNLLTGLLGHADMLRDEAADRPGLRGHVDAILRDLDYASRLTRQLRSLGSQQVVAPEPLDLNVLVSRAGGLLENLDATVTLEFDLAPALPLVLADPTELEQVLVNLVSNACQASDRTPVRVATGVSTDGLVQLVVRDHGPGMDPDTLARAREPFFTTRPTASGGPGHMGLGLAMVDDIAERNGGRLELQSAPGRGTEARVLLPMARAEQASPHSSGPRPLSRPPSETILLVDDEPVIRDVAQRALGRVGYEVLTSSSGPDAIELARAHDGPIDLLLTDVMMPEMNGRELADLLCAGHPGLRVLFISGFEERIVAPTGVLADGVGFLAKPFRIADLLAAVRDVLDDPDASIV